MESSGGQIVAESAGKGRGSTFILSLPFEIASQENNLESLDSVVLPSPSRERFRGAEGDQDGGDREMSLRFNFSGEQHNLLIGDAEEESQED